jgi:hypothetical protein
MPKFRDLSGPVMCSGTRLEAYGTGRLSLEEWQKLATSQHIRREGYTFHGLRASSVENLREAGCDDAGVESITGMSQAIIRRYSRFVDQRRLAKAAVLRLERTGRER